MYTTIPHHDLMVRINSVVDEVWSYATELLNRPLVNKNRPCVPEFFVVLQVTKD